MCVIEKDATAVKRHVEDSNDADDDADGEGDEYAKKSC